MYAQLGDIVFELITYWDGLNASWKTKYAQHDVIEDKPRLQWIGDELEEIAVKLKFHSDFCVPKDELQRLKEAMLKHEALDFVFGNGEYKGKFVIEEISSEVVQTFEDAEIIAIEAEVKLKEYVRDKIITTKKEPKKGVPKKSKTKEEKKTDVTPGEIVRQK